MERKKLICLIMATMMEAEPFILGMAMEEFEKKPFQQFKSDGVILAISGIGKANAAICAAFCLHQFEPSCLCNLGAAGTTWFSHHPGEIFQINKIIENDRPDLFSGTLCCHEPNIIDNIPSATLSTSDRAILDPEERKNISEIADLIDMEGASIVQACSIFEKRCYVFKFVSDTPEDTKFSDVIRNIKHFGPSFFNFFKISVMPMIL